MKTNVVRLFLLAILLTVGWVFGEEAYERYFRKSRPAPKQDQHWEDVKQTIPENASDLDTPEIIAERRRAAVEAAAERRQSSSR